MEPFTRGALILSLVLLVPAAGQHPFPFQQWQEAVTASHLGVLKTYRGDFDGAIVQFSRLIQLHPYDAIAYYNRALAESAKRDFEKAIADFTRAIQLNPHFARAYNDRGLISHRIGQAQAPCPCPERPGRFVVSKKPNPHANRPPHPGSHDHDNPTLDPSPASTQAAPPLAPDLAGLGRPGPPTPLGTPAAPRGPRAPGGLVCPV